MPTFCRHNRFVQNCPICTPRDGAAGRAGGSAARGASSPRTSPRRAGTGARRGTGVRVVHETRASDDGYRNALVPGLKSSADAARLADELAFSTARVDQLATGPPGLYAEVAAEPDREEATWLAFLIAYLCPLEAPSPPTAPGAVPPRPATAGSRPPGSPGGPARSVSGASGSPPGPAGSVSGASGSPPGPAASVSAPSGSPELSPPGAAPSDPFAAIRGVRVRWSTGEVPDLTAVETGPRTAHELARGARTIVAYRSWAARAGSQQAAFTGEPSWSPQRRFERAFERLALPGLHRAARFELLASLGRLGLYEVEAGSLQLGTGDATELATKRLFAIGERAVLERRAAELAAATGTPVDALDLAFFNFGRDDARVALGSTAVPDEATHAGIRAALGLAASTAV